MTKLIAALCDFANVPINQSPMLYGGIIAVCCEIHTKLVNTMCGRDAKGKAIPLQTLTVFEGSRRLRLPDFKTIGS
jgi:hypothetical protein